MAEVPKMQAEKLRRARRRTPRSASWTRRRHRRRRGRRRCRQAEGDHQGRPERVLHLHDRRDRDDPQRLVEADAVASKGRRCPFKIQYRYRPHEYGDQLVRMYLLTNDKESKLGTTPLPDGIVRVFRDNGRDGLSYLTQQPIKYIPIGDKIELNLGPDPEVIFELIKLRVVPRQPLAADQRHQRRSAKSAATESSSEVNATRRRLGRPRDLHAANPQLHGQADRRRNPPHASTATSSSGASSSRSCTTTRPSSS